MFALRRAATRALTSPAFTPVRSSQSIRSYSVLLSSRQTIASPLSSSITWQRRFASDDAEQSGSTIEQAVGTAAEAVQESSAPDALKDVAASAAGTIAGAASGAGSSTVFCGNLFYHITEEQLGQELSKYGKVESARITKDPRGLSRGFGFVKFSNAEEAAHAIEAGHNTDLSGRLLSLAAAKDKPMDNGRSARPSGNGAGHRAQNPPSRTLWIGNMSYDMTDTDLNALFRPLKNVLDVRVAIDRKTGQARGFAHADFMDVESATEAFKQLDDQIVYGRRLKIDYGVTYANENRNRRNDEPAVETPQPTDG